MGAFSPTRMEITFIVSAAVIIVMIALRVLELKFQRPIILAHISWPMDRRMRVYFKSIKRFASEKIQTRIDALVARVKLSLAERYGRMRVRAEEYFASLHESLRGKKALSRGSVSFFLLNISDYNADKMTADAPNAVNPPQAIAAEPAASQAEEVQA